MCSCFLVVITWFCYQLCCLDPIYNHSNVNIEQEMCIPLFVKSKHAHTHTHTHAPCIPQNIVDFQVLYLSFVARMLFFSLSLGRGKRVWSILNPTLVLALP